MRHPADRDEGAADPDPAARSSGSDDEGAAGEPAAGQAVTDGAVRQADAGAEGGARPPGDGSPSSRPGPASPPRLIRASDDRDSQTIRRSTFRDPQTGCKCIRSATRLLQLQSKEGGP